MLCGILRTFSINNNLARLTISHGKKRHEMMAEEYMKAVDAGNSAIVVNPTHRENNDVSSKIREKLKARDFIHNEREMLTFKSLNWTAAQKKTYKSYQPGMILDYRNNQQENFLTVQKIIHNKGLLCKDNSGKDLIISRNDLVNHDVFEKQSLQIGIGDKIMLKAGGKNKTGEFSNGEIITVKEFDKADNIISSDGRILTTSKFSYGYASTSHKSQGTTCHSIQHGDRQSVIEMLENENPQEQKSKSRIYDYMDSLQDFCERAKNKLFNVNMEKNIETEYQQEIEMEYQPEIGMSM